MFGFDPVQLLDGLLNQSLMVVALVRGPDHKLVFANESFTAIAAPPVEVGKSIAELLPACATDGRVPLFDQVLEAGERRETRNLTLLPQADDRGMTYWNCEFIPMPAHPGEAPGILFIAHEITREREVAKQAEDQAALLDAIMENVPIGLAIADRDEVLRRVSRYGLEESGRPREEVEGRIDQGYVMFHGFAHMDGTPQRVEEVPLVRAIRQREVVRGEQLRVRAPDGTTTTVAAYAAPVLGSAGAVVGGVVSWHDITALKQMEDDLREAVAAKDVLLRELSHRVKNNLQTAASLLTMQAMKAAQDDVRAQLNEAAARIGTLAAMHRHLYDRPHFDARLDFAAALRELASEVAGMFQVAATIRFHGSQSLDIDADTALPLLLLAHELLVNVYKHAFLPPRTGTVTLAVERHDGGCTVTVADDGIGLPEQVREGSFGMSLVQGLARQVNGTVDVRSDPGKGTSVTVSFPYAGAGGGGGDA